VDPADAKADITFGNSGAGSWRTLLNAAFDNDRAKTLAWMESQPATPERDAMLREGIWGASPEEKFRIYADLTPEGRAAAAERVVEGSFRNAPDQIESWVKSQPPGAAREAAIRSLASSQATSTPELIGTLADAWPAGPDRDAALRGIALSLWQSDPRRAIEFARRVSEPDQRESTLSRIAGTWLSKDESAARAWLASSTELSSEEKRVLLRQFDER
jgi:hypothetical protein